MVYLVIWGNANCGALGMGTSPYLAMQDPSSMRWPNGSVYLLLAYMHYTHIGLVCL